SGLVEAEQQITVLGMGVVIPAQAVISEREKRDRSGEDKKREREPIPSSIPHPERGRSTAFASLRSKCCRVRVRRSALVFANHRGGEFTPTGSPRSSRGSRP